MKALSIRQPWAWAIVTGHKTIENRSWTTPYRGPLLIHAGKILDREGSSRLAEYAHVLGFDPPAREDLPLGGIVGWVTLSDVVDESDNFWFRGPFGWILTRPRTLRFQPCPGQQRLFDLSRR